MSAEQARFAASLLTAQPVPPAHVQRVPSLAEYPEGIFETTQAPLRAAQYAIRNTYQVVRRGVILKVYAGSLRTDPTQGVLVLLTLSPTVPLPEQRGLVFQTPEKLGSLHIDRVDGDVILISTDRGHSWTFDVRHRRFGTQ